MSNNTHCNLEEVMRGLSISSPDEVGGGGPALNHTSASSHLASRSIQIPPTMPIGRPLATSSVIPKLVPPPSPMPPLEDKTTSGQGVDDEVFVDEGVAEERGNADTLDQRELLDTTDALLMDATNKMDDTAFLDEVIARNCRSFGSTDDDYIDEVIARCFRLDMIIILIF